MKQKLQRKRWKKKTRKIRGFRAKCIKNLQRCAMKKKKTEREVEKTTDNRKQHNSDLKGRFMQPVKEKKCKKAEPCFERGRSGSHKFKTIFKGT